MIHLIIGPMYSGKTSELTKRIRRAKRELYNVIVVTHSWDTRYSQDGEIVTHDKEGFLGAHRVQTVEQVRQLVTSMMDPGMPPWVFVDEAQFITGDWSSFCMDLAHTGCNVTLAALNADWKRRAYPAITAIVADSTKTLKAVCHKCQQSAIWSKCLFPEKLEQGVLIGGAESWEARCRKCIDMD